MHNVHTLNNDLSLRNNAAKGVKFWMCRYWTNIEPPNPMAAGRFELVSPLKSPGQREVLSKNSNAECGEVGLYPEHQV